MSKRSFQPIYSRTFHSPLSHSLSLILSHLSVVEEHDPLHGADNYEYREDDEYVGRTVEVNEDAKRVSERVWDQALTGGVCVTESMCTRGLPGVIMGAECEGFGVCGRVQ